MNSTSKQPIRLSIQQPSLAKYRVPVYRELSKRESIQLHLWYGDQQGIPNVEPSDFQASFIHMQQGRILGRPIYWHWPQWRCATRKQTDVLILSWNLHYACLIPSLLRARMCGVRTILWGHGYSKQEAAWRRWPRERVAGLADALLFYNQTAADQYLSNGFDPNRVFVALNAIDQSPIQSAKDSWIKQPDQLAAFKQEHKLGSGPIILFVSRLDPENRLDLLIAALPKVLATCPNAQVLVIGKGEDEQTRLLALANTHRVAQSIRFLGPVYGEQELAPWFLSSDVFCYPANIGLSLLHAFGYGLPVITSDQTASQNPEIEAMEHGANGLLYRHGDIDDLASQLLNLLTDHDKRARMSENAKNSVTSKFTLANMVNGMEAAAKYAYARNRS